MIDTLYKYQIQQGETKPLYIQPLPSWGWFAIQIETDLINPILGWFGCDNVCITEWAMTPFATNKFTVKIDLNNQDSLYNVQLFAMVYENPQTIIDAINPTIVAMSEPFMISENWQNIHEFEFSNNEMIDSISYANWNGFAYSQFMFEENEFATEETVYIDSLNTKQKLSSNTLLSENIETSYIPKYELERLNLIAIHDIVKIDSLAYICEPFKATSIKKYALMQSKATISKSIYNYQNSNC